MDSGYDTIATRLNLATVLQALDQYSEAEKILKDLQEQYPSDYRFDMQMAYLLIDWQGAKQTEQRDYCQAENCYVLQWKNTDGHRQTEQRIHRWQF